MARLLRRWSAGWMGMQRKRKAELMERQSHGVVQILKPLMFKNYKNDSRNVTIPRKAPQSNNCCRPYRRCSRGVTEIQKKPHTCICKLPHVFADLNRACIEGVACLSENNDGLSSSICLFTPLSLNIHLRTSFRFWTFSLWLHVPSGFSGFFPQSKPCSRGKPVTILPEGVYVCVCVLSLYVVLWWATWPVCSSASVSQATPPPQQKVDGWPDGWRRS